MSVLINMDMPKACDECKLRIAVGCCGNLPHNTRMPNCPLGPVPKHGRLIDADALIELIEFEVRHYVVKDEFDKGRVAAWNNIIRAIREYAPTIIPASEVTE